MRLRMEFKEGGENVVKEPKQGRKNSGKEVK